DSQGRLVAFFGWYAKEDVVRSGDVEPGVLGHFAFELARTPARITERDEQICRATACGHLLKHVARGGEGQLTQRNAGTVLAGRGVQHEPPVSLHRPAEEDRGILYGPDL